MENDSSPPGVSGTRAVVREQASHMSPASKADFDHPASHAAECIEQTRIYCVEAGDTPASLARRFYGNDDGWQRIFDANRDQLTAPDRIAPGQMLKIPATTDRGTAP